MLPNQTLPATYESIVFERTCSEFICANGPAGHVGLHTLAAKPVSELGRFSKITSSNPSRKLNMETGTVGSVIASLLTETPPSPPVPSPPALLSPGSGGSPGPALTSTSQMFAWVAVSGATRCVLYVRDLGLGGALGSSGPLVVNDETI